MCAAGRAFGHVCTRASAASGLCARRDTVSGDRGGATGQRSCRQRQRDTRHTCTRVHAWMHVCAHVHVCGYMYTHARTHKGVFVDTCTCRPECKSAHVCGYLYVYERTHARVHGYIVHVYVCTHNACRNAPTGTCACVWTCMCAYIRVCTYMCAWGHMCTPVWLLECVRAYPCVHKPGGRVELRSITGHTLSSQCWSRADSG